VGVGVKSRAERAAARSMSSRERLLAPRVQTSTGNTSNACLASHGKSRCRVEARRRAVAERQMVRNRRDGRTSLKQRAWRAPGRAPSGRLGDGARSHSGPAAASSPHRSPHRPPPSVFPKWDAWTGERYYVLPPHLRSLGKAVSKGVRATLVREAAVFGSHEGAGLSVPPVVEAIGGAMVKPQPSACTHARGAGPSLAEHLASARSAPNGFIAPKRGFSALLDEEIAALEAATFDEAAARLSVEMELQEARVGGRVLQDGTRLLNFGREARVFAALPPTAGGTRAGAPAHGLKPDAHHRPQLDATWVALQQEGVSSPAPSPALDRVVRLARRGPRAAAGTASAAAGGGL
jgi:hypothetical protein